MSYQNILYIDDEDDTEIFIAAAKEISPEVIFLDLNMPIMNGQQFLEEIKKNEELKNIPIIIFSTTANFRAIQLTKELGAHSFITKPGRYDELVKILKPLIR